VIFVNPEGFNCLAVSGASYKMPGYRFFIACLVEKPPAGCVRVHHGLLSSKGFRRNQEQGRLGIKLFQSLGNVSRINIRYKMHAQAVMSVRPKCMCDHAWSKI